MNNEKLEVTINNDIIESIVKHHDEIDTQYNNYVRLIVNHAINSMVDSVLSKQFDSLLHQLEIQRKSRNRINKTLQKEGNSYSLLIYNLGKYDGVYSTMVELVDKTLDQNQLDELYKQVLSKKYLVDIIEFLYKNPLSRHRIICDAVGIKPNYLSELMISLNKNGLINKYSISKFTSYSLTEKGNLLYKYHIKNSRLANNGKIRELKNKEFYIDTEKTQTSSFGNSFNRSYVDYESKKADVNYILIEA